MRVYLLTYSSLNYLQYVITKCDTDGAISRPNSSSVLHAGTITMNVRTYTTVERFFLFFFLVSSFFLFACSLDFLSVFSHCADQSNCHLRCMKSSFLLRTDTHRIFISYLNSCRYVIVEKKTKKKEKRKKTKTKKRIMKKDVVNVKKPIIPRFCALKSYSPLLYMCVNMRVFSFVQEIKVGTTASYSVIRYFTRLRSFIVKC